MQEQTEIPSQEDVRALEELQKEAIANGVLGDQASTDSQQAESVELDAEDKDLLDQAWDKIGDDMRSRTDELVASGLTRNEAGAQAIEEFFGPRNDPLNTGTETSKGSNDLRPSTPEDVAKALADNPEAMNQDNEDGVGLAAVASIGQEPWTVDVPNDNEGNSPNNNTPTSEGGSRKNNNEENGDGSNDKAHAGEDDPRKRIGEAVNKRIEELVNEGMSESDAHAQAHDEFWGKPPVDNSDNSEPPEPPEPEPEPPEPEPEPEPPEPEPEPSEPEPEPGRTSGELRPSTPEDVAKALADNPEAMDSDSEDGVGSAAVASIGQEPWTFDEPNEEPPEPVDPPGPVDPPESPQDSGPLKIGIASLSKSLDAASSDAAEVIKDRETTQRGFRGFLRKIWHGGAFQALPFQRNRVRARQQMVEAANLHLHTGGDQADMDATVQSVVGKITHDNIDDFLATGSGETHRRITDQDDPQAVAIRNTITDLIRQYADGTLDDDNFEEAKNSALRELAGNNSEYLGEGDLFADNLLEIAQVVRSRVSHDLGVEAILADATFDIGQIRTDAKTEAQYGRIDRVIDRVQDTRYGGLVNETTLVTAVSAMAAIGKITENIATSKALKMVGIGFIAGAVIGYRRQSKVVKDERRHHLRERASGLEITSGSKRRERLEATRYQTISATGATEALDGYFGAEDDRGLRELNDLTPEQFMQALLVVSEIQTRDRISDDESIDLFDYTSPETIGDERLQLQASALYTSTALSRYLEAQGGVSWLINAGLVDATTTSIDEIRTNFDTISDAAIRVDITDRDRAFNRLRRKEAFVAGTIGATVGVTIGFATQELMAHIPGIGDSLYGLGEGPVQPGGRGTTLAGLFGSKAPGNTGNLIDVGGHSKLAEHVGISSRQDSSGNWILEQAGNGKKIKLEYDQSGMLTKATRAQLTEAGYGVHDKLTTPTLSGKTVTETIGNNKITLPKEFKMRQLGHGRYELLNPDGTKAHDVSLNFDGSFDDQTLASLKANGVNFAEVPHTVTDTITVTKNVPQDIIKDHFFETKFIHREFWAANNTPAPKFDLNELRADAGGINGSWFNEQGDVVIDVSRMTPNGSFQGAYHINPLELAGQGKLSLGVSLSQDTQATPFNFPIEVQPDGRVLATIPKASVANQLFKMEGGERVFNGRVFEILHNTGQINPNGSEDVVPLASLPGTNNPGQLTYDIDSTKTMYNTILGLEPPKVPLEVITYDAQPLVDAPPVIPFYARRGLESLRRRRTSEYYDGAYGARSPEQIIEFLEDVSPILIDNPRARVQLDDGVNWYDRLLRRRRGDNYADRVNEAVLNSPELSAIDDSTDAIIAIPVRASTEAENIYSTLSLYGQQPDSTQNSSTVLLHLNWVDSELTDPSKVAEIQRTRDEIERAKRDFPGLKIAIMETEFKPDDIKNGAIGVVVRKMYDAVILSTKKAIDEGRMSPDHEVVLIRNDSDAKGMSPSYIERMVSTVKDGDTDAASGRIRWGIEQVRDLPGLSVVTQFYEGVRGSVERASKKGINTSGVTTVGINTGVRVSTLAAVGSIGFEDYTDAGLDDLPVAGRINSIRMETSPTRQHLYARRNKKSLRGWLSKRHRLQKYADRDIEGNEGDSTVVIASGSMIDSDALRLEESYRKGEPVHLAWRDWGSGPEKHKERGIAIPVGAKGETLKTKADMDEIAKRIEFQISEIVNGWRVDPRHAEMELHRMFPGEHGSTESIYSFSKTGGVYKLEFTDYGKEVLRDRLTRNNSGKWDPVGSRRMRANYGTPTAHRSFPDDRTPRLVKAIK